MSGNNLKEVTEDIEITIGGSKAQDIGVDKTQTVGGNSSNDVSGNLSATIGGNKTEDISGGVSKTVGLDKMQTITGASKTLATAGIQLQGSGLNLADILITILDHIINHTHPTSTGLTGKPENFGSFQDDQALVTTWRAI